MRNNAICRLLGIEYPVLQGGMAWVSDAPLCAAVSNAGGLGIISAMNADEAYLRCQIREARERTDKPIGVNIMLMSPFVKEVAQVVAEEMVDVVTTGAGLPTPYMAQWLAAGVKVIPVVPSTAIAKMVARSGACAVIAEGGESGGHVGDLTTMTLVPQVCDAVDIPVIAAGGIADGRGMAAAFMLGAAGVQCGTRFLASEECTVHENYKNKVVSAKDIDTIMTGKRLGHPVRCLKTKFARTFAEKEYDASLTNEELEAMGAGALRLAAREGDLERGSFMAGQSSGLIHDIRPVKDIIVSMVAEAEALFKGAPQWV